MKKSTIYLVLILTTSMCVTAAYAEYKPGTYTAQAIGKTSKKHDGVVEVEVTLSASKIENIKVLTYNQSLDHKKYGAAVTAAKTAVPKAIVAGNGVSVDGVAKATLSSNGIKLAVAKILHENTVTYKDGTYKGAAIGKTSKKHVGTINVEVTVTGGKIADIKVVEYDQSLDHKKYGAPVTEAKTKIPADIIAAQTLAIDGVAKATLSSSGIQLAVADALAQAR